MTNNLPPISSAYRAKLISAIISITLFFIVYLILIFVSLLMIFLLGYGAIKLIMLHANYFTAVIALGLISIGLIVFYFLIKFIFIKNTYSTRHLIEIDRKNQPELFTLIDEIIRETKVSRPGKVFLSPEVNASVSYSSPFWSMFLPVKKNLTIGIGLVNTVTVGELKTVLAHEFGHFSQRSMKIGGYVNQAEKIIFDTVYNNKDFENSIKHGSGHWAFQMSGIISVGFISAFQYILKIFSDFLFKKNASLRREMEFHADAVATYVTNPKEQISALLRMQLSNEAFNSSFVFFAESNNKFLPEDLFENQTLLLKVFSERNNYFFEHDLPKIDLEDINRYNTAKIKIEDQWSFHPEMDKRVEMILKNKTKNNPENSDPAKNIIRGYKEICRALTSKYLTLFEIKNVGETLEDNNKFLQLYNEKYPYRSTNSEFNGYYENHNPVLDDMDEIMNNIENSEKHDFFNDENVNLVYEKAGRDSDLSLLNHLIAHPKTIKTFSYNGRLYKSKDARLLIPRIKDESENLKKQLIENDIRIFSYFYSLADHHEKGILAGKYRMLASLDKEFDIFHNSLNNFIPHLQFMMVTLPMEEIRRYRALLLKNEKPFKDIIKHFIEESSYKNFLRIEDKQLLQKFINSEYIYFNNDRYIQKEVDSVFHIVNEYQVIINRIYTDCKEELLEYQKRLEKAS